MNQVKFCITEVEGQEIKVDIEGKRMDIVAVLATVIADSEELQFMLELALMAVNAKKEMGDGEMSDEQVIEMLSKIKPIAQA